MSHHEVMLQSLFREDELKQIPFPKEGGRMYAIAFDLDTQVLQTSYGKPSWQNAYNDIKVLLVRKGFVWQQGSVYFGRKEMTAVQCVLAAQALSAAFPWFKGAVRDMRMLRIEEFNDLMPAL